MVELPTLSPVVYRSPFTLVDGSPTSITSPQLAWNPRDEIFRRFSDPAQDDERKRIAAHVQSAEAAYNTAVKSLQVLFKKEEVANILSPVNSTKKELHRVALDIQRNQATELDRSKVGKLVNVLDHYQGVFDILSQADFSYLPLLWGGLKFVLIMSKNHCDLLTKITDMIIEIGLNLQRVQVYATLFPTSRMIEFASELYAAIVEFLQQVIAHSQKKSIRRYMSSFWQPFDIKFGSLVMRIDRIHRHIEKDAHLGSMVVQMVQSNALAKHRTDLTLQRCHLEESLKGIAEGTSTLLFQKIKKTLFNGFELEAGYHEELATTYKVTTSAAWDEWFKMEQQYVPSGYSHETTLVQAECDAPDPQHALLWVAQQRKQASQIPSTYLIWTRGMTAQSAVASLVFQILSQKPQVISMAGLNMKSFGQANTSIKALWALFLHLTKVLGGCMVYISIGSVGPEEFAIVGKFVDLVKKWDGPAINVTLIHPFHEKFARTEDVVDLDEKYDVHPSLTTTDAMHHVLLLELNIHDQVSDTVHGLLWETVWREVRYAVISIALTAVIKELHQSAKDLADEIPAKSFSEKDRELWNGAVFKWTENKFAMNVLREQMQRHLNIVDLHLPPEVKSRLSSRLKLIVFSHDMEDIGTHPLSASQRTIIYEDVQDAIRPGTQKMFCGSIPDFMADILDDYRDNMPDTERRAKSLVSDLARDQFGKNGKWKETFLDAKELIVDGITDAIEIGFEDVVEALLAPGTAAE